MISAYMISNRGQNREFHEDWVASRRPTDPAEEARKGRVYVVAGGMGCGRNGEVASRSAVETIIRKYYAHSSTNLGDSLEAAFQAANSDLHLRSMFDPTKTACASALAMVVRGSEVAIINVGTNLAYAVGNGAAKRITRRPDHGGPGPDLKEARAAGGVGVATRALGSGPGLAADVVRGRLDPGDRIVLCSDGLHGVLDDREITYAARGRGPEDAARALMSLAQERGAEDDVSVIVVDCGSTPRADPAPPAGEPAKPPLRRLIQWRPSRSTSRALLAAGVLLLFTIGAAALIRGWTAAAGTLDATAYRPTPTPAPTVKQAPAVVPPATPPTKLPAVTSTPRLPTPLPVVAPVTEPTPSPTPSPTPTPEPSPTVAPVGVPTATPDPSPTPAAPMPTPAPAPTATPEPAATPIPDPTATPSPPIVIPLSTPTPQPAATPTPLPAPTAPPPTPTPKPSPPPTPIVLVTPAPQSPGARVEPGPKIGIPVPDMAWKWAGAPGPDFAYLIEVWERSPSGAWNLAPVGSPPGLDPFQISSSLTSVRPTWVSWKSGTVYRWRLKAYSKTGAGQSDFSDYLFFQTP